MDVSEPANADGMFEFLRCKLPPVICWKPDLHNVEVGICKKSLASYSLNSLPWEGAQASPKISLPASGSPEVPPLAATASAAGTRVCFYTDMALLFQAFHVLINYISVQGAHNTSALTLNYQVPRTVLYTSKFQQLPAKSISEGFCKWNDKKMKERKAMFIFFSFLTRMRYRSRSTRRTESHSSLEIRREISPR